MIVLERMLAQLAAWDAVDDGRAIFLDCYAEMTRAVTQALDDGRFEDARWVATLLDRFAEHYFESLDGGPLAVPIPEPWMLAHAAAIGHDATTLQLLLAGVSAHINYDLVLTLVELLEPEWPGWNVDLERVRRHDYDEINVVIGETANLVQDRVLERRSNGMAALDTMFGPLDERFTVKLLTGWRHRVWRDAQTLLSEPDTGRRVARTQQLERQCARRARWILA